VREFLDEAFGYVGLDWSKYVEVDARYFRPSEVDYLQGDPGDVFERLGWRPRVDFRALVRMMVDHDGELARRERLLQDNGVAPAMAERA
jgi:GDPmannose 4,6-dehydratase